MSSVHTGAAGGADHEARTLEALRRALADVPFYAKHAPDARVDGALDATLRALPLLTRAHMRSALPKAWAPAGRDVKAELSAVRIHVVETGTASDRVRILWEDGALRQRERDALLTHPAARAAIEGGDYRDAILFVPERGTGSCGSGDPTYEDRLEGDRLHLNSRQDPTFWTELVMTRMLDELAHHRTAGLVADPFYADVLARHAAATSRRFDVTGFVALSRALTTTAHRAALAQVFDPRRTFQVFGSRETGPLFVEGEDELLHHTPFSTHVELLPAKVETPGADDVALIVVTSIDREVQPLVRYVTGDLARVARSAEGDATGVRPLAGVEGKLDDAIVRPDGAIVTPAALDRALAAAGVGRFQLTQSSATEAELEVVDGSADDALAAASALLTGITVRARKAMALAVEPNGKLKLTRRRFDAPLLGAFGGQ